MSDIEPSVVFRTGPITERDYDEAIEYLQEAKRLGTTGCPCGDSGHSAESCHHNPLLQARRGAAKDHEFRCFHCGQVFSEETAQEHFGNDENGQAKCESEVKVTVAQLREPMACGHPKACWKYESCCDGGDTPPNSKIGGQPAHADYNGEGICDFLCNSYCAACAREKATLALFAQQVAEHCRVGIKAGPDDPSWLIEKGACSCGNLIANGVTPWKDLWREHILSLVPDPSALAAHDAALRETLEAEIKLVREECREALADEAKLEADNARLREKLGWALNALYLLGYTEERSPQYKEARKLAEPPETQGKETV